MLLPWIGLNDSVLRKERHAEPSFALHHAGVSVSSPFERNCFDHRANILQNAEGKRVLAINRRAGQAPVDRAPAKDEWDRAQLDLVFRRANHDELAAGCETGHKSAHCGATG